MTGCKAAPNHIRPGPGVFLQTYQSLIEQGATAIFSIHITQKFSNICNVARLASEEIHDVPVHVIDSGNLTMAEGLIVLAAAQAAHSGATEQKILDIIEKAIEKSQAYAKLDTVDYLQRSGRLSNIQHGIISLLDIKPILRMNNHLAKMDIVRTRKKAFARVVETAKQMAPNASLFGITHANVPEQVEELLKQLKDAIPNLKEPMISEVTPALGTHVGPGALCLSWLPE
ncbi:MAG: DegV family protein [Anaerolineaceae bacterium]|nr:DegV family protein [Anaerolineaceae bacterium]